MAEQEVELDYNFYIRKFVVTSSTAEIEGEVNLYRKIGKSPGILSKIIDHEAIVILPAQGQGKVLNEVGARIWELADGGRSIGDWVNIICAEHAVARGEAEQDALEFIHSMREANLVIITGWLGECTAIPMKH